MITSSTTRLHTQAEEDARWIRYINFPSLGGGRDHAERLTPRIGNCGGLKFDSTDLAFGIYMSEGEYRLILGFLDKSLTED